MASLAGRVALVTGSARGVGRAMAEGLAKEGADIALHYRTSERDVMAARAAIAAMGVRCEAFQADVTDSGQVRGLVAAVEQRLGSLDVLVNNVGDYVRQDILGLDDAEWHAMFDSNLHSAFYACRAAIPGMQGRGWGRIVNMGFAGIEHVVGKTQITPYFIAKQGLLVLTRTLAKRLARSGVTVNMVSPGVLETSVSKPVTEIPMGRLGTVDEFVGGVRYLVGAPYVTGQNLEIAGGWGL